MGGLPGSAQLRALDEESLFPLAVCQTYTFPVNLRGLSALFDITGVYSTAAC